MRPVYLEFCGINSFSEKAEIDFTKLLDGGLFGIFGDTGSGKSTILDCIHFALYGKIERSSGTDSINYKCDKAYVIYAFEILEQGKRRAYRVRRERRRKNNVAKAFLDEYDEDGNLRGLAEGVGEVDRRIEEIVGLSFDDFKKCIALPQGEFAGLVKAKPSERLQLVSRLFDLEKYGDKLSATIRSRSEKTSNEAGLLLAKMQENAGGSEETIRAETEKLRLARRRFGRLLLHVGVTLQFVVNLQQHVLQAVADNRIAEHIVAVAVGVCGHLKPSTGAFHDAGGRIGDRIFAQHPEKRRFETEAGFGEKVPREGAEGHPEILRAVGQHQQRAGQHQNQRVAAHLTAILVHGGLGAALAAVEDRPAFAAARIIAEKGEIGLSDDELFFRCGYYGVSR